MQRSCYISILLFSLFPLHSSLADIIKLKNGDQIRGSITTLADNKLTISTEYGGDITIDRSAISNLETDEAITLKLQDKSLIKGRLIASKPGEIVLLSQQIEDPVKLRFDQITAVNSPSNNHIAFTGHVNLGGFKSTGNTKKQAIHADFGVEARGPNNRFRAGAEYHQSSDDGDESENKGRAYLGYDHFFTDQWYAYAGADFQKDKFSDLNLRSSLGGGLGYQFWETDVKNLRFEAGPTYVLEDFIEGEDRDFTAARWAVFFDYWVLPDHLKFFHDHEGLLSLDNVGDILVRSHTGFRVPVWGGLNLTAQIDVDYDTEPAPGAEDTDIRYIFGLGYLW